MTPDEKLRRDLETLAQMTGGLARRAGEIAEDAAGLSTSSLAPADATADNVDEMDRPGQVSWALVETQEILGVLSAGINALAGNPSRARDLLSLATSRLPTNDHGEEDGS